MEAVDHFERGGRGARRDEQGRGEPGGGYAEADGKLLHGAGDGTAVARLRFGEVGVSQSVHAGVLHRSENSVHEGLKHDDPNGGLDANRGKQKKKQTQDDGIGNEEPAIAQPLQNPSDKGFAAHRAKSLRHDHESRLNGGKTQSYLVEKRQEERHAANANAGEETAADGRAKRSNSEQT